MPNRRKLWIVFSLVLIVAAGSLIRFGYHVSDARRSSEKISNLSSLVDFSRALLAYTTDFDDCFPPNMDSSEAAAPYVKYSSPDLFSTPPHKRGMYIGNGRLARTKTTSVKDPGTVIMFFDTYIWEKDNDQAVAFVDGSTKYTNAQRVSKAIAHGYRVAP